MNKLEKMKKENTGEIERVEEQASEPIETNEKKFFSLFTFWKKLKKSENEEDLIIETTEKKERRGLLKYVNARTGVLAASLLIIAVAGYLNVRFSAVPEEIETKNGISLDALSPENTDEINTLERLTGLRAKTEIEE